MFSRRKKKKIYIRHRVGAGQAYMAAYLGISSSALSMWEQGNRSLPTKAVIKLAQLEIDFEKIKNARSKPHLPWDVQQRINEQDKKTTTRLYKKLSKARIQAHGLQEKLDNAAQKRQELVHWLNLVKQRLEILPKITETKIERAWLVVEEAEVSIRILRVNKELTTLQLRKELLEVTMPVYEAYHRALNK